MSGNYNLGTPRLLTELKSICQQVSVRFHFFELDSATLRHCDAFSHLRRFHYMLRSRETHFKLSIRT